MKTRRRVCSICLLAGALVVPGCTREATEGEPVVRPVRTMVVEDAGGSRKRPFSGVARAAVETILSFRVGGKIVDLPVKIGTAVQAGDLIARLDTTDYQLQVKQLEAQFAQAEAQFKQARAEYERVRLLYESENASKSDLDNGRAAYESASAQRDAITKSLELAQQQLGYCTLTAPIDGAIASKPVEVHQTVQAGAPIATLSSGDEMEMEIGIPEALIMNVQVGDEAEVSFEALPGQVFEAEISEVGVEPSGSTYPVKLVMKEGDERIRAGMTGEALLSFRSAFEHVFYVPPVAVVGAPGGARYLWVFDETRGTVRKQDVEVGSLTSDGLEILSGLEAGDRIVIRGVNRVEPGMKVRLMDEDE